MRRRQNIKIFIAIISAGFIVFLLALAIGGRGESIPPISTPAPAEPAANAFFPVGVEGNLTETQEEAFKRLENESLDKPSVRVDNGVVRFASIEIPVSGNKTDPISDNAMVFLENYKDLFDLESPFNNLQVVDIVSDGLGNQQVIFSQSINKIPVYGALIRVRFSPEGEITLVTGAYIPGPQPFVSPLISQEQAIDITSKSLEVNEKEFTTTATLLYFDEAVFAEGESRPRLVWQVKLTSVLLDGEWTTLVDSSTGEILRQFSNINPLERSVWDNHGNQYKNTNEATQVMDESGCLPNQNCDSDATNAYDFSGQYGNFLLGNFNRSSYDGKGAEIKSFVHVGEFRVCAVFAGPNAAWVDGAMYYSNGWSRANDVIAHEITHGLIHSLGGLTYERQPGALNESYADIFAVLMDNGDDERNWQSSHWQVSDWEIAEDLENGPFRDLSNPSRFDQPDHMSGYKDAKIISQCLNDNGFVHDNSGIPNKAAYLLIQSESITYHGITVRGIGPVKVAKIYYYALVNHINPAWTFRDARDATLVSCLELLGDYQINDEDCRQVANAFASVGIGHPATSLPPPNILPPELPISNSSSVLIFDTSGSMNEPDQSGKIKLHAARAAANNILEVIQAENQAADEHASQAGLVDFNFTARIDAQLSQDIATTQAALQKITADGGTGMPDGLKTGIDMLSQDNTGSKRMIILLSDGMANIGHGNARFLDRNTVRQQVLDQATRAGQEGICIYTVGFGVPGTIGTVSGEASIDEELLRQIPVNAACGDYYNARNASELANVYVEVRHVSTGNLLISQAGQIAQDQQVDIGSVQVPKNQSLLLYTLNWPGSQLDPILLDPRGKRVDDQYPGASISSSSTIASVIVEAPRSGQWKVAARGVDVPEKVTTYNAILSTRQGAVAPASTLGPGIVVVVFALAAGGFAIYARSQRKSTKGKRAPKAESATTAALLGLSGAGAGKTIRLQASGVLIGRSSGSNLRLVDRAVSRHHARIRYAQGSWYLQDLGSSGGTFVNGARVTATVLNHGDKIRIGLSEFEFRQ